MKTVNIKLNKKELSALMDFIELDTATVEAENNWEDTTCAVSDLNRAEADNLFYKLYHGERSLAVDEIKNKNF